MLRRFPLREQLPDVMRGVILDVHWQPDKLHELAGLIEREVLVSELVWHLGLPFWSAGGVAFQVRPLDVLEEPDRYHAQWARTLACDLSFPLHARLDESGRVVILDGVHRLLKAVVIGQGRVQVRLVSDEALHAISTW